MSKRRRVVLEFVLIVVGVLAALGLEEVWQSSQDRRREADYVVELEAEAEANLSGVRSLESEAGRLLGELVGVLDAPTADASSLDGSGRFETMAAAATFSASVPQISNTVVEDLISTGNLGLIRELTLRRSIQETHARISTLLRRMELSEERVGSQLYSRLAAEMPVGFFAGGAGSIAIDPASTWSSEWASEARKEAERLRLIQY